MIVRDGAAVSFLVEFPSGFPDGNITWVLKDESGGQVATANITPSVGAVSIYITIDSTYNELATGDLSGYRDLSWFYLVGGAVVTNEVRYTLEARAPFGAAPAGVRRKLGLAPHELPDNEIPLIRAFYDFDTTVGGGAGLFTPTASEQMLLADAIEALAALNLIPSLTLRIAQKESSGTDTFQRSAIDLEALKAQLLETVSAGAVILVPTFDVTSGFGALFILASPSADAFTGV